MNSPDVEVVRPIDMLHQPARFPHSDIYRFGSRFFELLREQVVIESFAPTAFMGCAYFIDRSIDPNTAELGYFVGPVFVAEARFIFESSNAKGAF